jgi:hypothetical protein
MTDPPTRPDLELVTTDGPQGGPVFRYRDAEIRCAKDGHVCALFMEGHPFHGATFGAVGTVRLLVDLWIKGRLLPGHLRAVPKPEGA